MTCVPGKVRTRLPTASYNCSKAGYYLPKEWMQCKVKCNICGQLLTTTSLKTHLEKQHSKLSAYILNEESLERPPPAYIPLTSLWAMRHWAKPHTAAPSWDALTRGQQSQTFGGTSETNTPSAWWRLAQMGCFSTPNALIAGCKFLVSCAIKHGT